jgi:hypothetical protein
VFVFLENGAHDRGESRISKLFHLAEFTADEFLRVSFQGFWLATVCYNNAEAELQRIGALKVDLKEPAFSLHRDCCRNRN